MSVTDKVLGGVSSSTAAGEGCAMGPEVLSCVEEAPTKKWPLPVRDDDDDEDDDGLVEGVEHA